MHPDVENEAFTVIPGAGFVPPYSQAGPICPGLARGIDRRVFPPPIDEDPDRKTGRRRWRVMLRAKEGCCGERPQKITFAEMRSSGVRGVLVYCSEYYCSHCLVMSADRWPDDVRLSDLEPRFVCSACGKRGADIRPNFDWDTPGAIMTGY